MTYEHLRRPWLTLARSGILMEDVVACKKKLDSAESSEEEILDALKVLEATPVTKQLLAKTHIAKTVGKLKPRSGSVKALAQDLVAKWRALEEEPIPRGKTDTAAKKEKGSPEKEEQLGENLDKTARFWSGNDSTNDPRRDAAIKKIYKALRPKFFDEDAEPLELAIEIEEELWKQIAQKNPGDTTNGDALRAADDVHLRQSPRSCKSRVPVASAPASSFVYSGGPPPPTS